jgi:hypothetical protein
MSGIYAYWEGPQRHWFYDLCWQTVLRWNPDARLLGRADVEGVLGLLPSELDDVYVVHRVDWLRKAFIGKVGGLWLDMDFVCWSDLSPLVDVGRGFDFVGWKEWHGTGWMDNLFAARRGSPILQDAADYALAQVRAAGKDVQWLATSSHAMNYAMDKHCWGPWLEIPTHLVGPVSVMDAGWFFGDLSADRMEDFRSLGFMTSMHGIGAWIKSFATPEKFLADKSRLAAIVRRGLAL